MTKLITAYRPHTDDFLSAPAPVIHDVTKKSAVVVRKGRPYVLATFRLGYTSARSSMAYAFLEVDPDNGKPASYAAYRGRADETTVANFLARKVFHFSGSSHPRPDDVLREIAAFFGYKNVSII